MKFQELQDKTPQELETLLASARKELVSLRMNATAGQLKNVRDIRVKRTLIARILTLQSGGKE